MIDSFLGSVNKEHIHLLFPNRSVVLVVCLLLLQFHRFLVFEVISLRWYLECKEKSDLGSFSGKRRKEQKLEKEVGKDMIIGERRQKQLEGTTKSTWKKWIKCVLFVQSQMIIPSFRQYLLIPLWIHCTFKHMCIWQGLKELFASNNIVITLKSGLLNRYPHPRHVAFDVSPVLTKKGYASLQSNDQLRSLRTFLMLATIDPYLVELSKIKSHFFIKRQGRLIKKWNLIFDTFEHDSLVM